MSNMIRTLASDEFEGRAPGTAGEAKTIAYIAEQFRLAGLEPAGENGGWTQKRAAGADPARQGRLGVGGGEGAGDSRCASPTTSISRPCARPTGRGSTGAPMVFVGYGVAAPERPWDDFKGVDLKGKVAVFLVNDPDFEARAPATRSRAGSAARR